MEHKITIVHNEALVDKIMSKQFMSVFLLQKKYILTCIKLFSSAV